MLLTNLGGVLNRDERICLWYCGEIIYRGEFSAIPRIFLSYPVDRIRLVDNRLHIYLV